MKKVTIYRVTCEKGPTIHDVGEGFSLRPWGHDTIDYVGRDDGGREYILPDGYAVGEDATGEPQIYKDKENLPTGLVGRSAPALVGERGELIRLRPADKEKRK